MLSKVNLGKDMEKKQFKKEMDTLEKRMTALQEQVKLLRIPVIIVFEGWGASGKGTYIGRVVYPLDPRLFNVYTMDKVTEDMAMRPFLWPYWTRTPEKGRIAIFDKSWHRIALPDSLDKWKIDDKEIAGFYQDVNAFERQLTDDGVLIIKLFLHISRDEQRKRFRNLEKNDDTAWRVDISDWSQNRNYDNYVKFFDQMIEQTNTVENPWQIIEADDHRYATVKIFKTIIERLEGQIVKMSGQMSLSTAPPPPYQGSRILQTVSPEKQIPDDEYREKLSHYQKQLDRLGHKLYAKRRPVVIVYEGWDAAGKGGNIKRLTQELDARSYEVVPVGAPSEEELAHHYLWRFYKKIPKDGHFTLYDRSWYGRVLVERVEQLTPVSIWQRAYREINEMEAHLINHGTLLFKFWLHIDKEEQLERFKARQNDPLKQYKITDDDWRNREKWELYEDAVDEMLAMTDTPHAPWTVVESNSKKYARIKVLETVVTAMEDVLR